MHAFVRKEWMLFVLVVVCFFLALLSITSLHPVPLGDSPSYLESMQVLQSGHVPPDFVPKRILTTFGGLAVVMALAPVFGFLGGWLVMNVLFYLVLCAASFMLLRTLFQSERVAFIGALLIAGNYAPIVFGLSYLMDAGGWAFYVLALWGVCAFARSGSGKAILAAAAAVGIGALFKEYALLGAIAIAVVLLYRLRAEPLRSLRLMVGTALIALLPVAIVHVEVFRHFGYTYLDWIRYNSETYVYRSRIIEYLKALGSLFNVLAPLSLCGALLAYFSLRRRELEPALLVSVAAIVISALPVFVWSGITQRVLFVLVPSAVVFACFLVRRYERYWPLFLPICTLSIAASFFMDSFILKLVNLPF